MSVLNDLGIYLQSVGVGILAQTIFKGLLPMDAPHILAQDSALALIEVPGLPADRTHDGPTGNIEQPMIQVRSRGLPHDYMDAWARADAAYLALDGLTNVLLNGTFYLWIFAQQPIHILVQADDMGRPHVGFTIRCGKSR